MCADRKESKPGLLWSVFTNKCPRCRRGKLFSSSNPYSFKHAMDMPEHCPVCGQKYELQTGFFFGTGFVSYALSVAVLATIFIAWAVLFGFSFRDNSIFKCLAVSIGLLLVIQPVLQRLSRSMWIAFFVRYDKDWRHHKNGSVPGAAS